MGDGGRCTPATIRKSGCRVTRPESERDRLASEMQTARDAIAVCEAEVDELADGQAPEAAPDDVQAPAEG